VAQVIAVLPSSQVGLDGKLFEPAVRLRRCGAAHYRDHFGSELEGRALELDTTRRDVKAEAEINVDDMACIVNHDVSVMPILELQQETDDAIRSHTLHKVGSCLLESDAILVTVARHEVVVQTVDRLAAQHIATDGIWKHINDTTAGSCGSDAIGENPNVKANSVEDATEGSDHLEGENVLATVVSDFEDG